MGRTHRDDETFPRLADPLGYVDKEDVFHAIKAIVATQRDYGRRDNRKQARLKYLVHEWGVDKFRCGQGASGWWLPAYSICRVCALSRLGQAHCLCVASWRCSCGFDR